MSKQEYQWFIGVKQIEARPAEKNGAPGYEVKYPDGYVSWSPKDVFEDAYFPMLGENYDGLVVTEDMVDDFILEYGDGRIGNMTYVHGVLRNDFRIMGTSGSVTSERYDHDIGMRVCKGQVKNEAWRYLGFVLAWAKNGIKGP